MGQAPGTHWYHAHKHGSTALNVANGMTGAFVIEGQYDDDLRKFYGQGFRDQVLVIQQLSSTPFPLMNRAGRGKRNDESNKPQLSVNGRLKPVVKMRPGEVQLWRLVNGAFRDAVQLKSFGPKDSAPQGGPAWRQIAQDGVQLAYKNYNTTLGKMNREINLAPANRADLLVKAPDTGGQVRSHRTAKRGPAVRRPRLAAAPPYHAAHRERRRYGRQPGNGLPRQ